MRRGSLIALALSVVVVGVTVFLAQRSSGRAADSAKARIVGRCLASRHARIIRSKSALAFAQRDAQRHVFRLQGGEALDRKDVLIAEQYSVLRRRRSAGYRLVILFEQHELSHPETPTVQRALLVKAINEPQTLPLVAVLRGSERIGHSDFFDCTDRVAPPGI